MPVNLFELYNREARIQTAFCKSEIVPRAIQLVPRMPMDKIIGKVFPLKDIQQVFEEYKTSKYAKILVEC